MACIGGMNQIHIFDSRRRFLHDPLQDALGARAMDLYFNSLVFVLKKVGEGGGRRKRQRSVPDHFGFLARRLNQRGILGKGRSGGGNREREQ